MTFLSDSAVIFDIQRFSLHDGPGIRTTIFFKGCPLSCMWCQNPESHKAIPEIAFYAESCSRCFDCMAACTRDAIIENITERIDYSKCDVCGSCVTGCVHKAIRMIGKPWDIETLIEEIKRDKDYFDDSGGGVTLSGGEPMIYSKFLQVLLPAIRNESIHITMETCGFFKWEQMINLIPYLNIIYFDLKHMDSAFHKLYTGQDNDLILKNLSQLSVEFKGLQVRFPVIPEVNDDQNNIIATAYFLKNHGQETIHCLPYHNMWESKIPRINTRIKPMFQKTQTSDTLLHIKQMFFKEGINAIIYE